MFEKWLHIPIPIFMHVYLYNCTNAAEIKTSSEWIKPHFELIGPYVFHEERVKENITWDDDNDLVSYKTRSFYHFEESLSKGSFEDSITALHVPSIVSLESFKDKIVN